MAAGVLAWVQSTVAPPQGMGLSTPALLLLLLLLLPRDLSNGVEVRAEFLGRDGGVAPAHRARQLPLETLVEETTPNR